VSLPGQVNRTPSPPSDLPSPNTIRTQALTDEAIFRGQEAPSRHPYPMCRTWTLRRLDPLLTEGVHGAAEVNSLFQRIFREAYPEEPLSASSEDLELWQSGNMLTLVYVRNAQRRLRLFIARKTVMHVNAEFPQHQHERRVHLKNQLEMELNVLCLNLLETWKTWQRLPQ